MRDRFWWPLDLSERLDQAVEAFRMELSQLSLTLDEGMATGACDQLVAAMRFHVGDILERDGLPHFCHIVNGWGDGRYRGEPLSRRLEPFVHRDAAGRPFLLQNDPEGDFHPWQTLAYAVMAGAAPDEPLYEAGPTLRELAQNSRYLNIGPEDGHELGHLLFALSYLDPDASGRAFSLKGEGRSVPQLVEMAVDAHHYGPFDVCRKFHLTEGLCAATARIDGLAERRGEARGFLEGQLDMLLLLGLILREARSSVEAGEPPGENTLLAELRDALVMGNYVENHFYYAGHLIEMAGFAASLGFEIAPEHRQAMILVMNELNALLPELLPHLAFPECFLHLGHYRRAVTLFSVSDPASRGGRELSREHLARFTADLDGPAPHPRAAGPRPRAVELGIYDVAPEPDETRPGFEEIVALYAAEARPGFEPRGKFGHFRRIGPPSWPRALHYELLDYDGPVGVEIHLESEAVLPLREDVRSFEPRARERFCEQEVDWDPSWSRERGRLRVLFREPPAPRDVVDTLNSLIDATFPTLDAAASRLRITSAVEPEVRTSLPAGDSCASSS